MSHQDQRTENPVRATSYPYEEPDVEDDAVWRFLRRSQDLGTDAIAVAVADYDRRVRADEPYEDAVSLGDFREHYLSR